MSSIQDRSSWVGKLFKLGTTTWVVYSSDPLVGMALGMVPGRRGLTTPGMWVVFLAAGQRDETIRLLFDDGSAGWIHGAARHNLTPIESSTL